MFMQYKLFYNKASCLRFYKQAIAVSTTIWPLMMPVSYGKLLNSNNLTSQSTKDQSFQDRWLERKSRRWQQPLYSLWGHESASG